MSADIRLLRWPAAEQEEYQRLTSAIDRVRVAAARSRGDITVAVPSAPEEPSDLDRARTLIAQHRARVATAGDNADLFADPAWQLMLVLFVAGEEQRSMTPLSAGVAAGVAPRVVPRWMAVLSERGLAAERAGFVALSPPGVAFIRRCLSAV